MAPRSFEQAVDRIRQLAESEGMTAFEMGDEVLAQAPMGDGPGGPGNGSTAIIQQLAVESGVDFEVLKQRRFVSSRVPIGTRVPMVAWAVYRQIAYVEDLGERGKLFAKVASETATQYVDGAWRPTPRGRWTVDAILTHMNKPSANPALGSDALLKRAFREATPEQIVSALEQPEIRRAVYEGLHQREQHVAERTERFVEGDPIARKLDQQQAMLDLQKWVDVLRRHIEQLHGDILPRLGRAPDRDPLAMRRFLAEALADLDEATAPVRTFVESGTTDIDRFLSEVLNRG